MPGAGDSALQFGVASFEHASCLSATAASFTLRGRATTLRSPRPGVSPPCPEHGGLASLSARARAMFAVATE